MTKSAVRPRLMIPMLVAALLTTPLGAQAGQRPPAPARGAGSTPGRIVIDLGDQKRVPGGEAGETRERFREALDRYPPSLARVLKLDPSLLTNQQYLEPYPDVAAFVTEHPEVAHNPGYFLEWVRVLPGEWGEQQSERNQVLNFWRDVLAGTAAVMGFGVVIWTVSWLIRMFVDYRRWLRLSKIQTEAHTKLLDRFTANEDLLNYIQSPAGRRFLESAPIPTESAPPSIGAPYGRMLWSMQAGVVLTVAGIGLEIIAARTVNELAQPLSGFGVLAMALGLGFIASAVIAYFLSRRLGLLQPPPPPAVDTRG